MKTAAKNGEHVFKGVNISDEFSTHADINSEILILSNEETYDEVLIKELGEKYKSYRDKWYKAAEDRIMYDFPLHIDFELMYYCNIDCIMCHMPEKAPEKRLDFNTYKRIIDEGAEKGLCAVGLNLYTEPFLIKNIFDYFEYARDKGIVDVLVSTNATPFNKKAAERMLDSGVTQLFFSIDAATKSTYDKIRIGSDWDRVIKNINYFLELKEKRGKKLPVTRVNFCRQDENLHEVEQFIEMWKDKTDRIVIQTMYDKTIFNNFDYKIVESRKRSEDDFKCPQMFQRVVVRWDGSLYPCANFYGKETGFAHGHIEKQSIEEYWHSLARNNMAKLHKNGKYWKIPICYACAYSYLDNRKKADEEERVNLPTQQTNGPQEIPVRVHAS